MRPAIATATALAAVVLQLSASPAFAQTVQKETLEGVTNFARVETTIACAGATTPKAMAGLKQMGYASIINLRLATEPGADIEASTAAARGAGLRYIHLPFDAQAPDPMLVDNFLTAVTNTVNQPAFVHCASGNRAAALWMIKRVVVDKWDVEKAREEATALGMTSPAMKNFVQSYLDAHKPGR